MTDWYTVPHEYGGRTLPVHKRLYIEWIWRRHGRVGLDAYLGTRLQRSVETLAAELVPAFEKLSKAANEMAVSFADMAKALDRRLK